MMSGSVDADPQRRGNFSVGGALLEQMRHLLLTLGEARSSLDGLRAKNGQRLRYYQEQTVARRRQRTRFDHTKGHVGELKSEIFEFHVPTLTGGG